jgi:hypothetical protein
VRSGGNREIGAGVMTMKRAVTSNASRKEPYLKGKNSLYLWSFVGLNVAVFLSLVATRHFDSASIEFWWTHVTAKNGFFAASIPLAVIIFAGLLSDTNKARLVFWRWRQPLPGTRVFSELIATDSRIDLTALKKDIGRFPRAPQEQNALWYKLYRKHKMTRSVWESHKVYLLTRDMSAIAALAVFLFSVGMEIAGVDLRTTVTYFVLLVAQYVLIAKAAHNYGNRFVLNVVCEESSLLNR